VPENYFQAVAKELGVMEATSINLSLVNEYQTNDNQIVYHFDFYRLKKK
jgi:tRNA threonylcarbamoyladenosine biosynthesis protein TsaE